MDISQIARLKGKEALRFISWVSAVLCSFVPGGLFLYFYENALFLDISTSKLLFLSFLLSVPIMLLSIASNIFFFGLTLETAEDVEDVEFLIEGASIFNLISPYFVFLLWAMLAKILEREWAILFLKTYPGLLSFYFLIFLVVFFKMTCHSVKTEKKR